MSRRWHHQAGAVMSEWSTDITKAPRGRYRIVALANGKGTRKVFEPVEIITASACGVVTVSRWLDDEKRFDMFTAEVPPIAWQPFNGRRAYVDAKGKTRYAVDLPPHPTVAEPWFDTFMRERKGTGTPAERQRECLDWIAARSRIAA
jgi:hypothetical protein